MAVTDDKLVSRAEAPLGPDEMAAIHDGPLGDTERDLFANDEGPHGNYLFSGSSVQVLAIGGGLHGLVTGQSLVTDGGLKTEDVVIVDRAGGWGGTWYWNRYPGVMCDIEGYSYLPLLEETGHIPIRRYPFGYEIREYCEKIAEKWQLRGEFGTTVVRSEWDETSKNWAVTLKRQPDTFTVRARWLICSTGLVPTPHVPRLNGIEIFRSVAGKQLMHTSRWDWEVSGGSQSQPNMAKFADKRVGIIGTGATAVQVIPHVARWAKHTYVFQRSPGYIGPHFQQDTTPELWNKVAYKEGWQAERMVNFDASFLNHPGWTDLVRDGWTPIRGLSALIGSSTEFVAPGEEEQHIQNLLEKDRPWTEDMRRRILDEVKDAETARKLTSQAPSFCKRPTFHNEYLSTFNKPEVTLVDTAGNGVTAYTPNGVMANDQEYEVDVLILATGYINAIFDSDPTKAINAPIIGKGGRSLGDKWNAEDFGVLFGNCTNGFPNLLFFTPTGSGMSANLTAALVTNARMISSIIRGALARATDPSLAVFEAQKDAEDEYTGKVAERGRWFSALAACIPSEALPETEQGPEGESVSEAELKHSVWGGGLLDFQRMCDEWKTEGRMAGFDVS